MNATTQPLVNLIRFYQRTLSPDHGWFRSKHPYGFCRFYPTCSQFAIEALARFGLLRGATKSFLRILRCNPWHRGGVDPVR